MMSETKSKIQNQKPKIALTIAGLDPSGGAGIIADIKTLTAFDCFPTAVISSITFQNTLGVFGAIHQTAESIRGQFEPIINDFSIAAIKTGMLPTREVIEETARLIRENVLPAPVVDPVVRSTSGFDLIDDVALKSLIRVLFPLACVVTPNIPEAERITGLPITNYDEMQIACRKIIEIGAKAVLLKGGHLFEVRNDDEQRTKENKQATDILLDENGFTFFESAWIATESTHGTGCTLSAGIAANLAHGRTLAESISSAKDFVTQAIRTAPDIGHGHSPINHKK